MGREDWDQSSSMKTKIADYLIQRSSKEPQSINLVAVNDAMALSIEKPERWQWNPRYSRACKSERKLLGRECGREGQYHLHSGSRVGNPKAKADQAELSQIRECWRAKMAQAEVSNIVLLPGWVSLIHPRLKQEESPYYSFPSHPFIQLHNNSKYWQCRCCTGFRDFFTSFLASSFCFCV
jgi:hypothetical protein